jgi:hypothetical protein
MHFSPQEERVSMARTIVVSVLLNVGLVATTVAQDCKDCGNRIVFVADNTINNTIPVPTDSRDSLAWYINLLQISKGTWLGMKDSDPTSSCLSVNRSVLSYIDTSYASSPGLFQMALALIDNTTSNAKPDPDYRTFGVIESSGGGYVFHIALMPVRGVDILKRAEVTFSKSFDPLAVGIDAAQKLGPVYTEIMNFEKTKRDQGAPYAIQPRITITPSKMALDFREATNVHVTATDCDGVPLRNRKISLNASGGTLTQSSVQTDNNGTADFLFTAGTTPTLAVIQGSFDFTTASEKQKSADITPAGIQIKKPANAWNVVGSLSVSNSFVEHGAGTLAGIDHTIREVDESSSTRIDFNAWVNNAAFFPDEFFNDSPSIVLHYSATFDSKNYSFDNYHNPKGYMTQIYGASASAAKRFSGVESAPTELSLSIDGKNYSFGIGGIAAPKTGSGVRQRFGWDPISGTTQSSEITTTEPVEELSLWIGNVSRDTSYTESTIRTVFDVTIAEVRTVVQKCSWKNNVCVLSLTETTTETTTKNSPDASDIQIAHGLTKAMMFISKNDQKPTAIESSEKKSVIQFSLKDNYPNPFNPSTSITYQVAAPGRITITAYDVLGRVVATLVDAEKHVGTYTVRWDASGLPSGVYFLQLKAGEFVQTRKLLLAK